MRSPPKPIRVFFSTLSRRFYATRSWREISPGVVECTGEKFDVTNDIAAMIEQHEVTFVNKPDVPPADAA
jgi:hypothetical protein